MGEKVLCSLLTQGSISSLPPIQSSLIRTNGTWYVFHGWLVMSDHGCPLPESDGDGAGLIQAMLTSSQVSHCKWFPPHCRGINGSSRMSWAHVTLLLIPKHFHMAHWLQILQLWLSHIFLSLLILVMLGVRLTEEQDEGFVRQLRKSLMSS